jgi:hypothetical protein
MRAHDLVGKRIVTIEQRRRMVQTGMATEFVRLVLDDGTVLHPTVHGVDDERSIVELIRVDPDPR